MHSYFLSLRIIMRQRTKRPSTLLAVITTIFIVLIFGAGVYLLNNLFYPRLLSEWKSLFVSVAGSLGVSLVILSGFAQISGYSIKDLFRRSDSEQQVDVMLPSVHSKPRNQEVAQIIEEIEYSLYSEDYNLPTVLTKCLILSELADLPKQEREWLSRELNGYGDLGDEEDGGKYIKGDVESSASHRIIKTYFKLQYIASETHQPEIMNLPVTRMFVPYPISQLIETIQKAKRNNISELSHILIQADRKAFLDVQRFTAEHLPGSRLPYDLRAYIKITDYEDILYKVRQRVLELVSQARKGI